jgi:cell division initiation protein
MTTTPVEIRHLKFGRSLRGYRRHAVDEALEQIADSFAEVWSDRGELGDEVERMQTEVARLRENEDLLKTTLIAAERSAAEALERAKQRADLVVEEAHAEARGILHGARAELERLASETRRVRALLRAALDAVEDADAADEEPVPDPWPTREQPAEVRALPSDERRSA